MPAPNVEAALSRGALIVTPNKRLAREMASRHDRAQVAAGRATWPAARVLPWTTFVAELVQVAQDFGLPLPAHRLDAVQSAQLWQRVVRNDLAEASLVSADDAADAAVEAWERVNSYGPGGDSWRGFAGEGPDVEGFVRWARAYARETARLDAVDGARAPDALVPVVAALPDVKAIDVVLVGFTEISPQQERLLAAIEAAGATVERDTESATSLSLAPPARLAETLTPQDELTAALDWARERALGDPDAQIAVVVPDLAQRRTQVRALAEDRLCPGLQSPGEEASPRPYDISIGEPLADLPLVRIALDLIALAQRPVERARAATLVRSPHLPAADVAWARRAALERRWLDDGVAQLGFERLVAEVATVDAALGLRWRRAFGVAPRMERAPPRAWVEQWRTWLDALGWGKGRAMDSNEFQALGAWNELLAGFARLSAVVRELSPEDALATLIRLARGQLFQPESVGARIRILGILEATGLSFDALWVAGMAADSWPQSPEPTPLLPIRWQRERGVPRSSPVRELAFARQLTAALSRAAPEVVFSYAAQMDEHPRGPSPLVAKLPRLPIATGRPTTAGQMFAERPALERIDDRYAPAVPVGELLPGGTGLIDSQSACPFRAVAVHRLRAYEWPVATLGLTPNERGGLVHGALAAFWNVVVDHARLVAMSDLELDAQVESAVAAARDEIRAERWSMLPPAVAKHESTCVAALVREWLVAVDRVRTPFTVAKTEVATTVDIAGFDLRVRLDRIDVLDDGGVAIVDYKTGGVAPPPKWFDPRPQGVQLAIYAAAQAQRDPSRAVRALAFGQVRPGEVAPIGLAESAVAWPALSTADKVRGGVDLTSWSDATGRLQAGIVELARACGAGVADVAPRDASICNFCHLHAMCRVAAVAESSEENGFEGFDDA